MIKISLRFLVLEVAIFLTLGCLFSCGRTQPGQKGIAIIEKLDSVLTNQTPDEYNPVNAMLILPRDPAPGERFRVLVTGGRNIRKARLEVTGPSGKLESVKTITGEELPCWRIDDFTASAAGTCRASLIVDGKEVCRQEFEISRPPVSTAQGVIWKTTRSWDNATETIY